MNVGRAAEVALALVYALSAAVQVNDPDPLRWIAIYGAATLVCALAPWLRGPAIPAIVAGIALSWGSTLVPGVLREAELADLVRTMKHDNHAEEARELGGLLIVAAGMALVAFRARRTEDHAPG